MYRRTFLETTAGTALAAASPMLRRAPSARMPRAHMRAPNDLITLRDPRVKALAHTALDAATSAGADYADVRLTYTTDQGIEENGPIAPNVTIGMSVRALVGGYWGWAATPHLSSQEAPRIGREATLLAQDDAAGGRPRHVEWGTIPVVTNGEWTTPIRIDPFDLSVEEVTDYIRGLNSFSADWARFRGGNNAGGGGGARVDFSKQERVFASTAGSYLTQTIYITSGGIGFTYRGQPGGVGVPSIQGGWENILDATTHEQIRKEFDRIDHAPPPLPVKNVLSVGRYDIVFTAGAIADILAATLIPATQVDRVFGYEANAGGTSYLGPDPLTHLGTSVAAPCITMTGDRSSPQGLATVKWDDDGMTPEDFTLVQDGVLVDYQTTREQASWLAPWYQKQGKPIRSHGCAASADALFYTMQHVPNITLHPGTAALSVNDLVASLDKGLLIDGLNVQMDFQNLNGVGYTGVTQYGNIFEIQRGRKVALLNVLRGVTFRSPEFWKSIVAVGGRQSLQTYAKIDYKGEPLNSTDYSLTTPPVLAQQVAVIDPSKKA